MSVTAPTRTDAVTVVEQAAGRAFKRLELDPEPLRSSGGFRRVLRRTLQEPYYRCRFPQEYALANKVEHPRNVYLREDAAVPRLDRWLARLFEPRHRADQGPDPTDRNRPPVSPPRAGSSEGTTTGETEDLFPDDYSPAAVGRAHSKVDLRRFVRAPFMSGPRSRRLRGPFSWSS